MERSSYIHVYLSYVHYFDLSTDKTCLRTTFFLHLHAHIDLLAIVIHIHSMYTCFLWLHVSHTQTSLLSFKVFYKKKASTDRTFFFFVYFTLYELNENRDQVCLSMGSTLYEVINSYIMLHD